MFKKISHYFLPHPETHQKAKLLSWQFLVIYILIFILVRVGLDIVSIYKPGVLGVNAELSVQKIIEDTNTERQKNGLAPVTYNSALSEAARLKAQNMFAENYWAHFSPSGKDPWGFMRTAGYRFSYAGENLARNFTTSGDTVAAWMASPTHRDNILNSKYEDIGIAVEEGILQGQRTTLVVQMFGHPYQAIAAQPPAISPQPKVETEIKAEPTVVAQIPTSKNIAVAGSKQEPLPTSALVDPLMVMKVVGFGLIVFISILLWIDFVVLRRRGVFRLSSAHVAHFSFLALAGVSTIISKVGEIL